MAAPSCEVLFGGHEIHMSILSRSGMLAGLEFENEVHDSVDLS